MGELKKEAAESANKAGKAAKAEPNAPPFKELLRQDTGSTTTGEQSDTSGSCLEPPSPANLQELRGFGRDCEMEQSQEAEDDPSALVEPELVIPKRRWGRQRDLEPVAESLEDATDLLVKPELTTISTQWAVAMQSYVAEAPGYMSTARSDPIVVYQCTDPQPGDPGSEFPSYVFGKNERTGDHGWIPDDIIWER